MLFVCIRKPKSLQITQRHFIGALALIAAGHIKDFHAFFPAVVQKIQRAGSREQAVGGNIFIPHRVIEELFSVSNQVRPIPVMDHNGIIHIRDNRQRFVFFLFLCHSFIHIFLRDIEALIIQRAVFCCSLLPDGSHGQDVALRYCLRLCRRNRSHFTANAKT